LKNEFENYTDLELEQAEIQMKYDIYIEKEKEMVVRMAQMEDLEIPVTFDFDRVQSIGTEAKEKLKKIHYLFCKIQLNEMDICCRRYDLDHSSQHFSL
jgi:tRNA U34 5-carboxymethylaminomethyl modifying enzyme MnmG/GidA